MAKKYSSDMVTIGAVSALVVGGAAMAFTGGEDVYGIPFTYGNQQYYVRDGSQRKVYPDREACLMDVPVSMQSQCEPMSNYRGSTAGSRYYGPVYHPSDTSTGYRPSSQYGSEPASSSNMGKSMPSGASKYGFGSTGKAHTSSKGS